MVNEFMEWSLVFGPLPYVAMNMLFTPYFTLNIFSKADSRTSVESASWRGL